MLSLTLRYAAVPVVFTVLGAAAGTYWPAMARWRSHVLHLGIGFAAGALVFLSAVAGATVLRGLEGARWRSCSPSAPQRCSIS